MIPSRRWLSGYGSETLRHDLLAGLTTGAVVIPQAMAYATIAGLPLQAGLYCALLPMAVYAVLGTSRPLSVSTTSTISLLTAQAIATSGASDPLSAAVVLAGLSGAVLLAAGILRLGFLADFISPHALLGFKIGTGLLIIADQVGKILGIEVTGSNFFSKAASVMAGLDQVSLVTVVVGGVSLAALVVLQRRAPGVPGPLVVLVLGILAVVLFSLDSAGVSLTEGVPAGLPSLVLPDIGMASGLVAPALGIGLMAFVESIGAARAFRRFDDPPLDSNQELRALGVAGLAGSVTQAFPVGGGLSQTAVNDSSGAATQAAGLFTAGSVLLTVTVLAPLFDNLAEATLGAIVLVAAAGLIDIAGLAGLRRIALVHWVLAAVPLSAVLVFNTLAGVLVGVVVSLLYVLHSLNRPVLATLAEDASVVGAEPSLAVPGVAIVRLILPVYYANERRTLDEIEGWFDALEPAPREMIVEFPAQAELGPAFVDFLLDLQRMLAAAGTRLHVAGIPEHAGEELARTPRWQEVQELMSVHPSVAAALDDLG